jgi:hypothetical protein
MYNKYARRTYKSISLHIRLLDLLSFLWRLLSNKLNPVPIWIYDKSDLVIFSFVQLLMELVSLILKPLTSRLDMVDADADAAIPSIRLHVAIVNFK